MEAVDSFVPGLGQRQQKQEQQAGRNDQAIEGACIPDDSSSVFLTSSDDMNSVEAIVDASNQPASIEAPNRHDAGLDSNSGRAAGTVNTAHFSASSPERSWDADNAQQPTAEPARQSTSARPAGPLLWRLFPRCIRATMEEICIAAEVTLNTSPSECKVTAVKEGVKLPVRLDFLSDRQATGDDADQPSRHGRASGSFRAAMQAVAAWQRRTGRGNVRHVLQSSRRPDTELVLIWVTPGVNPGMMLIEFQAPPPASFASGSGDGAAAASTGALESAWHSPAAAAAAANPARGGAPEPVRGIPPSVAAAAGWPQWPPAPSAASEGSAQPAESAGRPQAASVGAVGACNRTLLGGAGGEGDPGGGSRVAPLTASLSRPRAFHGLSAPAAVLEGDDMRRWSGVRGVGAMCSSGTLTVVVVPDAGMEAEVCALLAMQHQQMPLPLNSDGPGAPLSEETSDGPPQQQHQQQYPTVPQRQQQQQRPHLFAYGAAGHGIENAMVAEAAVGAGPNRASPTARGEASTAGVAGGGAASASDQMAVECFVVEGDEDKDDARARERFLWDLGAWLESSVRRAAAREALTVAAESRWALNAFSHRHLDQTQLDTQAASQPQPQQPRRVLADLRPVSEIESAGGTPNGSGTGLWGDGAAGGSGLVTEAWVPPARPTAERFSLATSAAAATAVPEAAVPPPRPALELLGFACSRGWAATATHIVLGLMDMGYSMRRINAAVQVAHGWSALHLAVASGSAELVAMAALWRSYGRYSNSAAVQDEWRAMLAAAGPGGLTPLHLAAVLPQPATAALDLLSGLPAETLTTWFAEAACDGCTPAHYASRAGNSHLNDHALLCLATGTAALDLGTAQGLHEVLPYLGELQVDLSTLTCSDSADLMPDGQAIDGGGSSASRSSGGVVAAAAAAAAATGGGGSLVDPGALSTPPPSPQRSPAASALATSTFRTASDGDGPGAAASPSSALARGSGLLGRAGNDGGSGSSSFSVAVVPPPQQGAGIGSMRSDSSGSGRRNNGGGSLRSAMRSALARFGSSASSSSSRGAAPAAPPSSASAAAAGLGAGPGRAAPSSSFRWRFLPRLTRLQCFGGGIAPGGEGGSLGPSAAAAAAAAGPDAVTCMLAPLGCREGLPTTTASPPLGATGAPRSSSHSRSSGQRASAALPTAPQIGPQAPMSRPAPPHPSSSQPQSRAADVAPPAVSGGVGSSVGSSVESNSVAAHAADGSGRQMVESLCSGVSSRCNSIIRSGPQPQLPSRGAGIPGAPQPQQALPLLLQLQQQLQPNHGSPAMPFPAVVSSEPWTPPSRGGWQEPSSVVTGLLCRVSPATPTHGSVGAASSPWGSTWSQHVSSTSKCGLQPASLTGLMSGAAGPEHHPACNPLAAMSLQQARQVALQMVAAAAAAAAAVTPLTASAPAGHPTAPPMGDAAAAAAFAAAGAAMVRSAPAMVGDRVLTELENGGGGATCGGGTAPAAELQQALLVQALVHRSQVRARMARMMALMRPGFQELPAHPNPNLNPTPPGPQPRPPLQQQQPTPQQPRRFPDADQAREQLHPTGLLTVAALLPRPCAPAVPPPPPPTELAPGSPSAGPLSVASGPSSSAAGGGPQELTSWHHQQQRQQQRQQQEDVGRGEDCVACAPRPPLGAAVAAAAEAEIPDESAPRRRRAAAAGQAAARAASAAADAAAAAPATGGAEAAAGMAAPANSGGGALAGPAGQPMEERVLRGEAASGAHLGDEEPGFAALAGAPWRQRWLDRRHVVIVGGGGFAAAAAAAAGVAAALAVIGTWRHPGGQAGPPDLPAHPPGHQNAPPTIAAAAAVCSWALLALAWPAAAAATAPPPRFASTTPGLANGPLSPLTAGGGGGSTGGASGAAIQWQVIGLGVHCVLLAVRAAAGMRLGAAASRQWGRHDGAQHLGAHAPAAGVEAASASAASRHAPDAGGAGGLTAVPALATAGLELLSAFLVGLLLLQVLFLRRHRRHRAGSQ